MNRLPPELDRLYGLGPNAVDPPAEGSATAALRRGTRAAVLEVVLPAGWEPLSAVWKGIQADLDLPAPAIAVSGVDGLQLWFSFASPISSADAARLLQGLRARYLPGVAPRQVRVFAEAAELPAAPFVEVSPHCWSAFVTPDLASVFADTPWLNISPNDEGQAMILRELEPMRQVAVEAALKMLGTIDDDAQPEPIASQRAATVATRGAEPRESDPARFLSGVMNDETAPLALRIEAAKILLATSRRS